MKDEYTGYAGFWMASSTFFLSLAVSVLTWLVSVCALYYIDWSDIINFRDELSIWISSVVAVVVFCLVFAKFWKSTVSVQLHALELIIGVLIILIGAGCFIAGVNYTGGQFLGGLLEILLGIYLGATGLLSVIAGGFGWLALKLSKKLL